MNAPLSPVISEALRKALESVSLDDKYALERGRAFMSGTQALVRLPMLQHARDRAAGLNTAGFVSGYRGSPLGGLDQALWKARDHLAANQVVFQPGLNEDLAATSVWGSQQVSLSPKAKFDGVFGLWYGKGPGVDRSGDVLKHANAAGTSPHGGAIVLAGDDHGAKSSTLPHQSDHVFKASGLPVFYPSSVQDYLDLGIHAWAMSRYSGLWTAMKTVTEVVEASATVVIDPERVDIVIPTDFELPPDGLNIRWPDTPLEQESRLMDYKWYAALAYVRANKLNRTVIDSSHAWFGVITGGKAYLDTRQALEDLGLDEAACEQIGIRLFKCDVVWPLEAQTVSEFARGLGEVLVVEEKRQIIEYALKEELYNWPDSERPNIYGKFDEKDGRGGEWAKPMGRWLLPAHAELSPAMIAKAIAARLLNPGKFGSRFELAAEIRERIESRVAIIEAKERALARPHATVDRAPTFCSGCPHNTSTHVPEGSRALAGIGCHYMTIWMPERRTETFTQMGGEGVPWIGQAPFTDETHVFANLGDGTYFHSGLLAIRASIAAGVNITYKILYNDAVAMTGGQPIDGTLTVPQIVAQTRAEGAAKIVVVTDEPGKYRAAGIRLDAPVRHRDELDRIQRELRDQEGVSILVYDQTCATEKRRRRKRIVDGKPEFPDPAVRVVINDAVCEGCGDCSTQSSCVSVEPIETEFGRKRTINQSSCNKDYSCVNGFCPSFVTVHGGQLRKSGPLATAGAQAWPELADPEFVTVDQSGNRSYGVLVTGVGGTGVVTIGQILGMAGHLEDRTVSVLDMAGLAQKGGAVFSHVQIAQPGDPLYATRIATGEADLLLGGDLVVSSGNEALSKLRQKVTRAVINDDVAPTSAFLRDPDWQLPKSALQRNILDAAGSEDVDFIGFSKLAHRLLGDSIYANPMMIGYAWQKGWIPLNRLAIERAIELNGVQVQNNLLAWQWGRRLADDQERVMRELAPAQVVAFERPNGEVRTDADLERFLERREAFLTAYQNRRWAKRFRNRIDRVRQVEADRIGAPGGPRLSHAVAAGLFKLMSYKDEYEVARLHRDPEFRARIAQQFEGDYRLRFHLAPPLLSRPDPDTGRPRKRQFGGWMMPLFGVLAKFRMLRATPLDPFGYSEERRDERASIIHYEKLIDDILGHLSTENYEVAIALARTPEDIRGYGPVKEANLKRVRTQQASLLAEIRGHKAAIPISIQRPVA